MYIALFSCCITRAIHLELVPDLSAEAFKRVLRRYTSRKGTPVLIVSDNAKTFQATEEALKSLLSNPKVANELESAKTEWRFNLERAPWWGGVFEKMVGSVKRCLRKILGNAKLTFDELLTVLIEIEGTLNSWPLTYEYNDVDGEVLTPSHLMFGRRIKSLPDERVEEVNVNETSQRYRNLNLRLAHFWNRWRKEYLTSLREFHRTKVRKGLETIRVGDVVKVFDEGKKRAEWKTAVVTRLIKGKDGVVRGADVRATAKGKPLQISRPVQKLVPLEISTNPEVKGGNRIRKCLQAHEENPRWNPERSAKLDACWKTRSMLDS